jgi:hypothetical protein
MSEKENKSLWRRVWISEPPNVVASKKECVIDRALFTPGK